MHHYFKGLDFLWCGSTSYKSNRIVKYLRQIDSVWLYWTWMHVIDVQLMHGFPIILQASNYNNYYLTSNNHRLGSAGEGYA